MLAIALRPDGLRAVIVGGGKVALRKAEALVAAGFHAFVVAPAIDARLRALLDGRGDEYAERAYAPGDLEGARLAIAASNDDAVNARVIADARSARILACDAGSAERGDFTMPATVRVGDLSFSVDSGDGSPAFSKRVVGEIAVAFGPEYGIAARTLARMRTYVKAVLAKEERGAVMRALAALPIDRLAAMNPVDAEHEVEATIERLQTGRAALPTTSVVCASRASALAMTQTRTIAARLAERGLATTILNVTTAGDRAPDKPIGELGTINVFVTELELALRERRADYAVHSCKDLPSELSADMLLAAISAREDARDAFCSERFADFLSLPTGAIVGTSSPRRRFQLGALRPDLRYEEMRGNVDTRLRKLREGRYDAIVLAMAGLNRLRARATYTEPFALDAVVPAVAQGALAVETRGDDATLAKTIYDAVNDAESERCVRCERAALRALRAGCNAPIGIHARIEDSRMIVDGVFAEASGTLHRERVEGLAVDCASAEALGVELSTRLAERIGARA